MEASSAEARSSIITVAPRSFGDEMPVTTCPPFVCAPERCAPAVVQPTIWAAGKRAARLRATCSAGRSGDENTSTRSGVSVQPATASATAESASSSSERPSQMCMRRRSTVREIVKCESSAPRRNACAKRRSGAAAQALEFRCRTLFVRAVCGVAFVLFCSVGWLVCVRVLAAVLARAGEQRAHADSTARDLGDGRLRRHAVDEHGGIQLFLRLARDTAPRGASADCFPINASAVILDLDDEAIPAVLGSQRELAALGLARALFASLEAVIDRIAHAMDERAPERRPALGREPHVVRLDFDRDVLAEPLRDPLGLFGEQAQPAFGGLELEPLEVLQHGGRVAGARGSLEARV